MILPSPQGYASLPDKTRNACPEARSRSTENPLPHERSAAKGLRHTSTNSLLLLAGSWGFWPHDSLHTAEPQSLPTTKRTPVQQELAGTQPATTSSALEPVPGL